jgi:DNA-directed RNA polymerase subunit RPC12/RpoP
VTIAEQIVCPDCGGECNLTMPVGPEDHLEAGDVLGYACVDCWSRWDIVVDDEDLDGGGGPGP